MSDFRAPVQVWLRPTTYRTLLHLADTRKSTVGDLLAALADNATNSAKHERTGVRRWKRTTPEQATNLIALVDGDMGIRPAAEQLGLTYGTAHRIITEHRKGTTA